MTNKQKIEKWLDSQIKAKNIQNKELVLNKTLKLSNASGQNYIHLFGCLHEVAKILELPVTRTESVLHGSPYIEDSFVYKDVQFIQLAR